MNLSRGVKILILNKEGMKKKISYERRNYEAVADAPQSNYLLENVLNIKSGR